MPDSTDALRLSIFLGECDQWHHKPTYHEIVHRAHKSGLAGATVLRGIEGYGSTTRIHRSHLFPLNEDLPLLVIITDTEDRVRAFLPLLDDLGLTGPVTLDRV